MAERPNALALKASVPNTDRGFKSLYLRSNPQRVGRMSALSLGMFCASSTSSPQELQSEPSSRFFSISQWIGRDVETLATRSSQRQRRLSNDYCGICPYRWDCAIAQRRTAESSNNETRINNELTTITTQALETLTSTLWQGQLTPSKIHCRAMASG